MILRTNIIELEGLAMLGKIKRLEIKDCDKVKGYKEIVAYTSEDEKLSTGCIESNVVRRNYSVLALYVKKWNKDIVREDLAQEGATKQI